VPRAWGDTPHTPQERLSDERRESLIRDLEWVGLLDDDGPEALSIAREAQALLRQGHDGEALLLIQGLGREVPEER
jgi:hypothetical protein